MFKGNSDSHTLRHSYLEHPVNARFLRIHVVDWHGHPSMRLELVGHQGMSYMILLYCAVCASSQLLYLTECNEIISEVPYAEITASSHKSWRKRKSCTPDLGDISSSDGWCPKRQTSMLLSSIRDLFYCNLWLDDRKLLQTMSGSNLIWVHRQRLQV